MGAEVGVLSGLNVGYSELKNEFKEYEVLTPAATVTIDLSTAQAFELTPNQNTNINFTNVRTGVPELIIKGNGTAYGLTFGINGNYTTPDIKKIDGSKNYDGANGVEFVYAFNFKKGTSPEIVRYNITTVQP